MGVAKEVSRASEVLPTLARPGGARLASFSSTAACWHAPNVTGTA